MPKDTFPSMLVMAAAAVVGVSASLVHRLAFPSYWQDRSQWSELPCIDLRSEPYRYRDDRPHGQGGRGDMLTGYRLVCHAKAIVGPVMPQGWRPA